MGELRTIEKCGVPEGWTQQLTQAVSAALREFGERIRGTPIVRFAFDCHPWNGFLTLALLTAEEADANSHLAGPAEMAAWRNNGFPDRLASWHPVGELGREMRDAYAAASDRKATADAFFRECGLAVERAEIAGALGRLDRRFQIGVPHPDDDREFFPPGVEDEDKRLG
jgi:hypothetical protein